MLVHISSSEYDIGETICSLLFARRARGVDSGEEASEVVIVSLMILLLRRVVLCFVSELSSGGLFQELRRRKEMCIAELNWEMKDAEEGLQKLRTHLRQAEDQLQEKKKRLLPEVSPPAGEGDPKGSPESPRSGGDKGGACRTHHPSSSLPRFMTSTVCSRQRRNAAVAGGAAGEVNGKARPARIRNLSTVDLSLSQSRSLLEPPSRLSSWSANSRTAKVEAEGGGRLKSLPPLCVQGNLSFNSTDSRSPTLARSRKVSATPLSWRAPVSLHRRRMSDLT